MAATHTRHGRTLHVVTRLSWASGVALNERRTLRVVARDRAKTKIGLRPHRRSTQTESCNATARPLHGTRLARRFAERGRQQASACKRAAGPTGRQSLCLLEQRPRDRPQRSSRATCATDQLRGWGQQRATAVCGRQRYDFICAVRTPTTPPRNCPPIEMRRQPLERGLEGLTPIPRLIILCNTMYSQCSRLPHVCGDALTVARGSCPPCNPVADDALNRRGAPQVSK